MWTMKSFLILCVATTISAQSPPIVGPTYSTHVKLTSIIPGNRYAAEGDLSIFAKQMDKPTKALFANETMSNLIIPSNEWMNSDSLTYTKTSCYFDCKNGSNCNDPPGVNQNWMGSFPKVVSDAFAPPPPPTPPQPHTGCGVGFSLITDPFVFLTNATSAGDCDETFASGSLWRTEIHDTSDSKVPLKYIDFCLDSATPIYVKFVVFGVTLARADYTMFNANPPSNTFDIPDGCKCL
eukprot:m.163931 g.163931  ORF g.163931 m.163931 type:complete len:237 (-) comp31314_c1_seq4:842-1552(-)